MKRSAMIAVGVALACGLVSVAEAGGLCGGGRSSGGGGCVPAEKPKPTLVKSVDFEAKTITIEVSGKPCETFALNNFTKVILDGKPGKIDDVREGMKVSVVGNGKTASRIEAETCPSPVGQKKK